MLIVKNLENIENGKKLKNIQNPTTHDDYHDDADDDSSNIISHKQTVHPK